MAPRKDLGSLLVDENVIGGKDLERVDRKGKPRWHALLDARITTEDELYFVMTKRYGATVLAESELAEAQLPQNDNVRRALGHDQALEAGTRRRPTRRCPRPRSRIPPRRSLYRRRGGQRRSRSCLGR
jgi:hypothetical protein